MVVKAVELDLRGKFLHEDKHQSFLQTVSIILYFGIFPKKVMKLIFCLQINIKLSFKLIPLILVGMTRPAQITQNNKSAKSFQYLKKEVKDEVDFLCR